MKKQYFKRPITLLLASTLLACSPPPEVPNNAGVIIYTAQNIITVNDDALPIAQAIAIDVDGAIIAVGALSSIKARLKGAVVDTRFEDKTIIPGLIDPHIHMILGSMMYGLDCVPP